MKLRVNDCSSISLCLCRCWSRGHGYSESWGKKGRSRSRAADHTFPLSSLIVVAIRRESLLSVGSRPTRQTERNREREKERQRVGCKECQEQRHSRADTEADSERSRRISRTREEGGRELTRTLLLLQPCLLRAKKAALFVCSISRYSHRVILRVRVSERREGKGERVAVRDYAITRTAK